MRFTFRLLPLILAAFMAFSCAPKQKGPDPRNPYGLEIINTYEGYLESVAADPDMELVDLSTFIPGVVLDIRYATENNFTGTQIYTSPEAYARRPVAEALLAIQEELATRGLGLKIFDAYGPYAATLYFYEVYQDTVFVASPTKGSNHNRGFAVDLTIINLETGEELEMPTEFDEFTEVAAAGYMDLPDLVIYNRTLLFDIMVRHGFTPYDGEWWHFNYSKERDKYPIMDIPFEELDLKK